MRASIVTGLTLTLTLACGRIDLGTYGMAGMTSNTDGEGSNPSVSQRPPDVIIIGPVTSETTLEPANPVTERPGQDPAMPPSDHSPPSDAGGGDAGATDAGADGGIVPDAGSS